MTAIAGLIGSNSELMMQNVQEALHKARRRYLGDCSYVQTESAVFGLGSTFPKDKKTQTCKHGDILVVLDGVILNKSELWNKLGVQKEPNNWGYLIALLYRRYGTRFINWLIGEFAIALWDNKNHKLILAVDYLGFRPLFYRVTKNTIFFGSTIAQLKRKDDVINQIHIMRIITSLCSGPVPTKSTTFNGIHRVVPGTYVVVTKEGHISTQRYWNIDELPEIRFQRRADYVEKLRSLIFDSVGAYIRSSQILQNNITVTFSGGLDSSTVLFSLLHLKRDLNISPSALTIRYNSLTGDEKFQDVLDEYPQINRCVINGSKKVYPFQDSWDKVPQTDEPSIPVMCTPRMLEVLAEGTKEIGSIQMFYGSGGDTLWEGHQSWIADAINSGQWIRAMKGILDFSRTPNKTFIQVLKEVLQETKNKKAPDYFFKPLFPPWVEKKPFEKVWDEFIADLSELDHGKNAGRRFMYTRFQIENCITPRNDYFFLKCGVEEVNPFFYRPLVEYMMTIPQEFTYEITNNGQWITKTLLREAMAGIVPRKILQRTTKGLAGDIELTGFKEGRSLFEKLFLDGECRLAEMGLVTPSQMAAYIDRWYVGVDTDWTFNTVATEMWLRQISS